jgi:hypothetical protein
MLFFPIFFDYGLSYKDLSLFRSNQTTSIYGYQEFNIFYHLELWKQQVDNSQWLYRFKQQYFLSFRSTQVHPQLFVGFVLLDLKFYV